MVEQNDITPELLAKAKEILEKEAQGQIVQNMPEGIERKMPTAVMAIDPAQAAEREPQATFAVPAIHTKPKRDLKDFSIARAIRGKATGNWRGAELEREWIRSHPAFVQGNELMVERTLDITDDSTGGFLVPEETAAQIIPMLKAQSVVRSWGAQVIPNCPASFILPAQSGATTAYWVGTGALSSAVTASDPTFKQIRIELKRIAGLTKIDMDLLMHSVESVEALVRRDIAEQIGLAEDAAFLNGTGGTQPLGLISWPNINKTENVGVPKVDHLFGALTALESRNATMNGWIMHPTVWNVLRTQQTDIATYIMQPNLTEGPRTQVLGFPVYRTTQLGTGYILAGNGEDYVIAEGGGLEIIVLRERFADFLQIGVLAVHRVDGAPRRTESFQVLSGVTPSP